jgi:hypothetical protein
MALLGFEGTMTILPCRKSRMKKNRVYVLQSTWHMSNSTYWGTSSTSEDINGVVCMTYWRSDIPSSSYRMDKASSLWFCRWADLHIRVCWRRNRHPVVLCSGRDSTFTDPPLAALVVWSGCHCDGVPLTYYAQLRTHPTWMEYCRHRYPFRGALKVRICCI